MLGPGEPDLLPRQGYRQLWDVFLSEWQKERFFGLVRVLRLLLIAGTVLFPVVHLDTLADWFIHRRSRPSDKVDARIVAVYREFYFLARALFLLFALLYWHAVSWVPVLCGYFVFEIAHAWLGRALAWGKRSIHPVRSLVLALLNYIEVAAAFAVLYLDCRCFNHALTPTTAFYFSLVTATTVGFGDFYPRDTGYYLVMWQIAVFFVFVVLVVSTLTGHLPEQKRMRDGA